MNKKTTKLIFTGVFLLLFCSMDAQKKEKSPTFFGKQINVETLRSSETPIRCGSYEYEQYQRAQNPKLGTTEDFEQWLAPRIQDFKDKTAQPNYRSANQVITIPVVVHVIHNNKPYGTAENITDEQVISQINILNEDYRRMTGTPGFNNNPVGADTEVQFCLAQRTPDGEETDGINRVNMATPGGFGWLPDNIDSTLKPATIWNPNEYLNIWVVDSILFGFIAGYAQFPEASGLPGIDDQQGITFGANSDGVVIANNCFGTTGTAQFPYNGGRTTSHEVGHWLGLRHIWGDSENCTTDDYCADTPNATSALQECSYRASCGVEEMKENYMNYTPDACMNIFTQDQKLRMRTVLENSPRRATLATSPGCLPVQTHGFDARIYIVNLGSECDLSTQPVVRIRNFGYETNITSATISYTVGSNSGTYDWSGNLASDESEDITLPTIGFSGGINTFTVTLDSVNNSTDDNTENDTAVSQTTKASSFSSTTVVLNLTTDNYGDETSWELKNSAGTIIYQGGQSGNYGDNSTITQTFELNEDECYTFTIYDEYGDGICCNYGMGSYSLTAGEETIFAGGQFNASESTSFIIGSLSVGGHDNTFEGISLYPNPTKGILNISVSSELPESYVIYNTLGQTVKSQKVNNSSDLTINTSSYSNGVYFVKITIGNQTQTLRFIKH